MGDIWFVRTMIAGESFGDLANPNHWLGTLPYGGVILDASATAVICTSGCLAEPPMRSGLHRGLPTPNRRKRTALIIGHMANGGEYELFTTVVGAIPWMERVEIYGSKGAIIIDHARNPVMKVYMGSGGYQRQGSGGSGVDTAGLEVSLDDCGGQGFRQRSC